MILSRGRASTQQGCRKSCIGSHIVMLCSRCAVKQCRLASFLCARRTSERCSQPHYYSSRNLGTRERETVLGTSLVEVTLYRSRYLIIADIRKKTEANFVNVQLCSCYLPKHRQIRCLSRNPPIVPFIISPSPAPSYPSTNYCPYPLFPGSDSAHHSPHCPQSPSPSPPAHSFLPSPPRSA